MCPALATLATLALPTRTVRRVPAAVVWPIRHQVMWPEKPPEYSHVIGDEDPRVSQHFGLYVDGDRLVSVCSLFFDDAECAQFRKFATLDAEQRRGHGSHLLQHVLAAAREAGARSICCNARIEQAPFYAKFGLVERSGNGTAFEKGGRQYIIMEMPLEHAQHPGHPQQAQ